MLLKGDRNNLYCGGNSSNSRYCQSLLVFKVASPIAQENQQKHNQRYNNAVRQKPQQDSRGEIPIEDHKKEEKPSRKQDKRLEFLLVDQA
jgi:hypothetical protein